jgi:quinoprotein dehydrogenase-associated probable ABC transporter substrate-binding protein
MYSAFRNVWILAVVSMVACVSCARAPEKPVVAEQVSPALRAQDPVLRVCADPNNLPFSNQNLEGFENRIADVIANDLNARVEYTWWAQRRGFFRNTLKAGLCDVVIGVPHDLEMAATTKPYYSSTYVFVYRKDSGLSLHSFDDEALKTIRVGVQMIGDDFSNAPPAHALSRRHIINNVVGYSVYGDYAKPNPPADIMKAVEKKQVDAAIVWGPLAGYFAKQSSQPLVLVPVSPQVDQPALPFVYDISLGVRRGDKSLRDRLDEILVKRRNEIDRILDDYAVPRVARGEEKALKG